MLKSKNWLLAMCLPPTHEVTHVVPGVAPDGRQVTQAVKRLYRIDTPEKIIELANSLKQASAARFTQQPLQAGAAVESRELTAEDEVIKNFKPMIEGFVEPVGHVYNAGWSDVGTPIENGIVTGDGLFSHPTQVYCNYSVKEIIHLPENIAIRVTLSGYFADRGLIVTSVDSDDDANWIVSVRNTSNFAIDIPQNAKLFDIVFEQIMD